ncbi:hypothetical protein [Cytobacillus sp. IB215665]|uniref:hypothetical protein n=1 Tax=Cytobacillus sp. IB215665 TaxID=3097357 RepID=UPI002A0F0C1A|nr:hypothetical protein [Cytobacillus sp. IB215665]MDX8367873.1 hypothetical protein [Cytobacillus sp. IB215665]
MTHSNVKRLSPKTKVLRELYLKSGNQCAFPGCTQLLIDKDGNFIGQVCHIEAAMPGGPRFNPKQTDEERRAYSNLMLLCYEHHIVTDDVKKYSVSVLKNMKKKHEKKYTDIVSKIQESISDITESQYSTLAKNCKGINKELDWGHNQKELYEITKDVNEWASELAKLPYDTRRVFQIMLHRSSATGTGPVILASELRSVVSDPSQIRDHYEILVRYGFVSEMDYDYNLEAEVVPIESCDNGWDFWGDLKEYCNITEFTLEDFIMDINFEGLDG